MRVLPPKSWLLVLLTPLDFSAPMAPREVVGFGLRTGIKRKKGAFEPCCMGLQPIFHPKRDKLGKKAPKLIPDGGCWRIPVPGVFWGVMGANEGTSGCCGAPRGAVESYGVLWGTSGCCGGCCGHLGVLQGTLGCCGTSQWPLGVLWRQLWAPRGALGHLRVLWGQLKAPWGAVGLPKDPSGCSGAPRGVVGQFKAPQGASGAM